MSKIMASNTFVVDDVWFPVCEAVCQYELVDFLRWEKAIKG